MFLPFVPPNVVLAGTLLLNSMLETTTTATATTNDYEFANGPVRIDNPTMVSGMTLSDPRFLGAGGGGSVWAMKQDDNNINRRVIVKISWARSKESVRNECNVLRVMEHRGVGNGVERCLGSTDYRYDPGRAVIVMEPFVDGGDSSVTASLGDLSPEIARKSASRLGATMAQMIASNVVTTDVQPLISKSTGDVLLIDMTEARVLGSTIVSDADRVLINAFCTEVLGLVPDSLLDETSESFLKELNRIETDGLPIRDEMKEILRDLPITGIEDMWK